jgi:protein-disulfide isomerase
MRLKFVRDIVLFFLVLGIGFVFIDYYKIAIDSKRSFNSSLAANAEENSGSNVVEMVLGNPDAPISLVEYAAYTCIHCANFHKDIYPLLKENYIDTGKVRFTYREVYFHRYGLWASVVARCGDDDQKLFFGLTDLIYEKRDEWINSDEDDLLALSELKKIGKIIGLSEDKLTSCLKDSAKIKNLVEWYRDNSKRDEVTSTPTLFVNGERFKVSSYEQLAAFLDEILSQ